MKKYFMFTFLLLSLLLQTACAPSTQTVEGEKWIIFSEEQASELGIADGFGQATEYWSPTEADVRALENGTAAYLQENADYFYPQGIPVWERLNEYNRQYAGLILNGKKFVYANYFCTSTGTDWKQDFVFVLDGGDCYFQFKYNADTGEFFDLQVNGEA